jgi:hypothetical protein
MDNIDYEQLQEENARFLECFKKVSFEEKIKEKTKNKHYMNVEFFVNNFLTNIVGKKVEESENYLDEYFEFFIRKCAWSTGNSLNVMITSLRKFYKIVYEEGMIEKYTYDKALMIFKENKNIWLRDVYEFNGEIEPIKNDSPNIDFSRIFDKKIDWAVQENYKDDLNSLMASLKEIIAQKPWEWMTNDQLLSVSEPEVYMNNFVSFMGHHGGDKGMIIHEDFDGFIGHIDTYTKEVFTGHDFRTRLNGYTIHFTEKKYLNERDLEYIKESNVNFKKNELMPKIMRYELGEIPKTIESMDVSDLSESLDMLLDLVKGKDFVKNKIKKLSPDMVYGYFGMDYIDTRNVDEIMEDIFSFYYELLSLSKKEVKEIKKTCKVVDLNLELDEFYLNSIVLNDDRREVVPLVFTVINKEDGFACFGIEILENEYKYYAMNHSFIDWIKDNKKIPKAIYVSSKKMYTAFSRLAEALGIKLIYNINNHMSDDFRIDFLERNNG